MNSTNSVPPPKKGVYIEMVKIFCEPEIQARISRFAGLVESSKSIKIRKKVGKTDLIWFL